MLLKGSQVGTDSTMKASERCYARSKLCNVLFTFELARRLSGAAPAAAEPEVAAAARSLPGTAGCSLPHAKEICVTAFNPGLMLDTNFVTSAAGTAAGWVAWVLTPLLRLTVLGTIMTTAGSSGVTLARLAMGELKATAQTAVYFDKAHEKPSSEFSRRVLLHDARTHTQARGVLLRGRGRGAALPLSEVSCCLRRSQVEGRANARGARAVGALCPMGGAHAERTHRSRAHGRLVKKPRRALLEVVGGCSLSPCISSAFLCFWLSARCAAPVACINALLRAALGGQYPVSCFCNCLHRRQHPVSSLAAAACDVLLVLLPITAPYAPALYVHWSPYSLRAWCGV